MKNRLKLAIITVATTNFLMGDMVFNLGAQQFSNSIDGNFTDSTYDLAKTMVSTSLKMENGHYIPKDSGSFKVQLKEPKAKWGVTFDMDAFLFIRGLGVTLLGQDGQVVTLFFSIGEISVDGKVIKDGSLDRDEKIIGSLHSDGKVVSVVINGKHNFKVDKPNFKLAYVEMNLGTDSGKTDRLNGLAISTSSN